MCVLQTLAWYLNPPTASQIANHVLSLVSPVAGAVIDWAGFAGRVHDLIDASLVDIGLSVVRPSTVALASIVVSAPVIRDPCERQAVLRATLTIMNRFDFEPPSEIDCIRTDLSFLARNSGQVDYTPSLPTLRTPSSHDPTHTVSPQSVDQRLDLPVHSAYIPSNYRIEQRSPPQGYHGVIPRSQVAMQTSLSGQRAYFCRAVNPEASNPASESMPAAQSTARSAETSTRTSATSSLSSSSSSSVASNDEDDLGSLSLDRGYSNHHYMPLLSLKISEERRLRRSSFHSSSVDTVLDTIPEYAGLNEFDVEDELLSLGVSTLSLR